MLNFIESNLPLIAFFTVSLLGTFISFYLIGKADKKDKRESVSSSTVEKKPEVLNSASSESNNISEQRIEKLLEEVVAKNNCVVLENVAMMLENSEKKIVNSLCDKEAVLKQCILDLNEKVDRNITGIDELVSDFKLMESVKGNFKSVEQKASNLILMENKYVI